MPTPPKARSWTPRPIDTSHVRIPAALVPLVERLAENNHDVWGRERLAADWKYGAKRDDRLRTHPDLIAYSELTDDEKRLDRATVGETIKAILASDFRIEPAKNKRGDQKPGWSVPPGESHQAWLVAQWRHLLADPTHAGGSPARHDELARALLSAGEAFVAVDLLSRSLDRWPNEPTLLRRLGHALSRSGATLRARTVLERLLEQAPDDLDGAGMLASTYKTLADSAPTAALARQQLRTAQRLYVRAWEQARRLHRHDDAIYNGVNAATLALELGRKKDAEKIARSVITDARCATNRYWADASSAEAHLVLGDVATATTLYREVSAAGSAHWADLASAHRNAQRVLRVRKQDPHTLDACFRLPTVIVFSGHMLDARDRTVPRFTPAMEPDVARRLRAAIDRFPDKIGYSGAASGSDILFLEAMQSQRAPVHIVLPCDEEAFIETSVRQPSWRKRFRRVVNGAASVTIAERDVTADDASFTYAAALLDGMALLQAQRLGVRPVPMALWDGDSALRAGGTTAFVRDWRARRIPPVVIRLEPRPTRRSPAPPRKRRAAPPKAPASGRKIHALLFADVVGFSGLREDQNVPFARHFMGGAAEVIARAAARHVMVRTWGDAIFLVYRRATEAAITALSVAEWVRAQRWQKFGLPRRLTLRIGLHAGPIAVGREPVSGRRDVFGTHVSWAARIEPIAIPGEVYASQPFAALAAAEGSSSFRCEYVGEIPLAKDYATLPVYHVRRTGPAMR